MPGTPSFESPRVQKRDSGFVDDAERVRSEVEVPLGPCAEPELFFEKAGPRERIFFEPSRTTAALVTCGGLSPGLNNVIHTTQPRVSLPSLKDALREKAHGRVWGCAPAVEAW